MGNLISIIIPTYNRAHLIGATLDSIQLQTFTNWECIVVDDGSTDRTPQLLASYISTDSRFKLAKNTRKKGAQGARNTGLLLAKGTFIQFFDSDNTMNPKLLESLVNELTDSNADIATCYSTILDGSHKTIGHFTWDSVGDISDQILDGSIYVDYNGALLRSSVIERLGLVDEDCPSFQEWDTHIRLSRFAKYTTVKEHLVNYYQRDSDRISTDTKRAADGYLYILSKHKALWKEMEWRVAMNQCKIALDLAAKSGETGYVRQYKLKLAMAFPYIFLRRGLEKISITLKLGAFG